MKKDIAEQMINLFKGRQDKVGLGGKSSADLQTEDELRKHIALHIAGQNRLGVYNLLPDGTCPWAVVEFENHEKNGGNDVADPATESFRFIEHMKKSGIHVYRELSKNPNGKCFHVWMFFDAPISAKKIHLVLKNFVGSAMGLNVEIFPKGYDTSKLGNFVNLPLFGGKDSVGNGLPQKQTVFVDDKLVPYVDQEKIIASIKKNSHAAIDKFIETYKLKTDKTYNLRESILTDGLDKLRKCPFIKFCEENAAKLSEPLWYAWITNAIRVKGGREYIHEYSKLYKKYSQVETDKKIAHALHASGPMSYEAIIERGWQGDQPIGFTHPIQLAYYKDINDEIKKIKSLTDEKQKSDAIRKLIEYSSSLSHVERDSLKDKLKTELKISKATFDSTFLQLANVAHREGETLPVVLEKMKAFGSSTEQRAKAVYEWWKSNGIQFYYDSNHSCYALVNKRLMPIDIKAAEFKKYFYESTEISLNANGGAVFVDVICNLTQKEGKLIEPSTWLYTNKETDVVYVSLNNEENQLAMISEKGVTVVDQADNADKVVMSGSTKILPISIHHLTDAEYSRALNLEKDLVVNTMACSPLNRLFVTAWRICAPLLDFAYTRPLVRFEGKTSSGKSFAFDLNSMLLYGEDHKKIGTTASTYSDAAQNPLLLLDNLEARNMSPELNDFMLTAPVGGSKEKRKSGTESGITSEKSRCLLLTNGIENVSLHEIINRMFIIPFDRVTYKSSVSSQLFAEIKRHRDELLSAEFTLLSKVFQRKKKGDLAAIQTKFETLYPNYSKSRSNEYFAMMIIVAEELLNVWKDNRNIWTLVAEWVREQENTAQDTSAVSNK